MFRPIVKVKKLFIGWLVTCYCMQMFTKIRKSKKLLRKKRFLQIGLQQRQRLGLMRPVVCKPKDSMMSLCSTAAPDFHTGQSKGRYRTCSRAFNHTPISHVSLDYRIQMAHIIYSIRTGCRFQNVHISGF